MPRVRARVPADESSSPAAAAGDAAAAALTPEDALALARRLVVERDLAAEGRVREGPFGDPMFVVRRDLDHLDADALSDRLQAWIQREVHPGGFEESSAFVSFDHAEPALPHAKEDPDHQEEWRNIEAVFRLDLEDFDVVTPVVVERWVDLIPQFMRTVGREGRPEGFRDVWAGAAE